ncbi:MAG: hypothetical protein ACRBCS_07915 [Cellvibrionaceae bacterium]
MSGELNTMDDQIREDILNEAARNYYNDKNLVERLRRRVKRKFGSLVDKSEINDTIILSKNIYESVKALLPNFTESNKTAFADPQDINYDFLAKAVHEKSLSNKNQFNLDDIHQVVNWVIYWEYLR